jgi:hypothetical protein
VTLAGIDAAFTGEVPPRLRARALEIVAAVPGPEGERAEHLVRVAVDATRRLLHHEGAGRTSALDLLAIDALVTHAMEVMADDPTRFEGRSLAALHALSSISHPA